MHLDGTFPPKVVLIVSLVVLGPTGEVRVVCRSLDLQAIESPNQLIGRCTCPFLSWCQAEASIGPIRSNKAKGILFARSEVSVRIVCSTTATRGAATKGCIIRVVRLVPVLLLLMLQDGRHSTFLVRPSHLHKLTPGRAGNVGRREIMQIQKGGGGLR